MPRIQLEVTDGFKLVCEKSGRSMAAVLRQIVSAYTDYDTVRKLVAECELSRLEAALKPTQGAQAGQFPGRAPKPYPNATWVETIQQWR